MKLGVLVNLDMRTLEEEFIKLKQNGFDTCQLCCWQPSLFTDNNAAFIKQTAAAHDVEISAFWCGWDGPCVWDAREGPVTIGLVPSEYRAERLRTLKSGAAFAARFGVTDIVTHVGFIPLNPYDPDYVGLVSALKDLAKDLKSRGQFFLFETGQETPYVLIRTIEDIGYDNIGINLDPANLLLYGMANPVDALDLLGPYIRNVHAKDGHYPTGGIRLGKESPIGQGKVNFPELLRKLKEFGYDRYLTIEREISGEQQIKDIKASKVYLERLLAQLGYSNE